MPWRALNEFAGTAWSTIDPATNAATKADCWPVSWIPARQRLPRTRRLDGSRRAAACTSEEIRHLVSGGDGGAG